MKEAVVCVATIRIYIIFGMQLLAKNFDVIQTEAIGM